jgi:hypothetical protein
MIGPKPIPGMLACGWIYGYLPLTIGSAASFSVRFGTVPVSFSLSVPRVWFRYLLHPELLLHNAICQSESWSGIRSSKS